MAQAAGLRPHRRPASRRCPFLRQHRREPLSRLLPLPHSATRAAGWRRRRNCFGASSPRRPQRRRQTCSSGRRHACQHGPRLPKPSPLCLRQPGPPPRFRHHTTSRRCRRLQSLRRGRPRGVAGPSHSLPAGRRSASRRPSGWCGLLVAAAARRALPPAARTSTPTSSCKCAGAVGPTAGLSAEKAAASYAVANRGVQHTGRRRTSLAPKWPLPLPPQGLVPLERDASIDDDEALARTLFLLELQQAAAERAAASHAQGGGASREVLADMMGKAARRQQRLREGVEGGGDSEDDEDDDAGGKAAFGREWCASAPAGPSVSCIRPIRARFARVLRCAVRRRRMRLAEMPPPVTLQRSWAAPPTLRQAHGVEQDVQRWLAASAVEQAHQI